MTRTNMMRAAVAIGSAGFATLAIAIWLAPDTAARLNGVEIVRAAGSAMLRSDFGGLFAGLAVLCGAAAWTRSRAWILAAAAMLAAVVTGRALGWISGGIGGDIGAMAIELALIALLIVYARSIEAPASSTPSRPARRGWMYAIAATVAVAIAAVAALLSPAMTQRIFAAAAQAQTTSNT